MLGTHGSGTDQYPKTLSITHCKSVETGLWNRSFQKQLCMLAASQDLLGDTPMGFSDEPVVVAPLPPPPKKALDRLFG